MRAGCWQQLYPPVSIVGRPKRKAGQPRGAVGGGVDPALTESATRPNPHLSLTVLIGIELLRDAPRDSATTSQPVAVSHTAHGSAAVTEKQPRAGHTDHWNRLLH